MKIFCVVAYTLKVIENVEIRTYNFFVTLFNMNRKFNQEFCQ